MTCPDYIAGILCALYFVVTLRMNWWKWPAGLFHCALFGGVFWYFKLYAGTTRVENLGVVFGLICVVLTVRRNIWSWPTGIVNIVFFFVMFWEARLYADLITLAVFFVLSIYGWAVWLRGMPADAPLVVELASPRLRLAGLVVIAAGSPALGWTFHRYTNASLPYWDSLITVMSLVAQWWLAKKYVENWILWIAVDVIAIRVYSWKGLLSTSVLYAVFLTLAIFGLIDWMRALRKPKAVAA
jgi:nicotinamide mononucleotide transporter